jgi:hypothetical protein
MDQRLDIADLDVRELLVHGNLWRDWWAPAARTTANSAE